MEAIEKKCKVIVPIPTYNKDFLLHSLDTALEAIAQVLGSCQYARLLPGFLNVIFGVTISKVSYGCLSREVPIFLSV